MINNTWHPWFFLLIQLLLCITINSLLYIIMCPKRLNSSIHIFMQLSIKFYQHIYCSWLYPNFEKPPGCLAAAPAPRYARACSRKRRSFHNGSWHPAGAAKKQPDGNFVRIHIYIYLYLFTCIYIYTCRYIYIYIYVNDIIYMCVNMHIWISMNCWWFNHQKLNKHDDQFGKIKGSPKKW